MLMSSYKSIHEMIMKPENCSQLTKKNEGFQDGGVKSNREHKGFSPTVHEQVTRLG